MKILVQKLSQENGLLRKILFQFLIDQLHKNVLICKNWQNKVHQIFEQDINLLKSKFHQKYSQLTTIQQFPYFIPLQQMIVYRTTDGKKMNYDFILKLHLKQNHILESYTKYTISYSYQLNSFGHQKLFQSKKKARKYFWKVQFQYIGGQSTPKTVWMYKDLKNQKNCESDNQNLLKYKSLNQDIVPYIMDCQPVRKGQVLQIKLPYCVRNHLIDFDKFQFYTLQRQKTEVSTIERFFHKKTANNCYIQSLYQWKKYDYYKNPISFQLDDAINSYKKQLCMQQIYINNLQDHFKIQLTCKQVLKESLFMSHIIQIKPVSGKYDQNSKQTIVQLKRKGIFQDTKKKLTFKIGDKIILYLCQVKEQ